MKKIYISFVSCLMTLILVTGCGFACEHVIALPTCDRPAVCIICEETFEEALGHKFVDGICSVCNAIDSNYNFVKEEVVLFAKAEETSKLYKMKNLIISNLNDNSLIVRIDGIFNECINNIDSAKRVTEISNLSNNCIKTVYSMIPLAGEVELNALDPSEETILLNLMDEYIFRNNLGGVAIGKYYTLNLNSTTQEKWIEFFGENGTIKQTNQENYWECKPFLANSNFIKGLNLALRNDLVNTEESTLFYEIDYSKNDYYKYDLELSRKYFALSLSELVENGVYDVLTDMPIQLNIEIAFGTKTAKNEQLFAQIKECIETAFNVYEVTNGKFYLTVNAWYGEYFGEIYGLKNYTGQFDLSYDKISYSNIDVYMKYKLLSSNPEISRNLTINWSIDTNNVEEDCIIYNGYRYSYDSLILLLSSK